MRNKNSLGFLLKSLVGSPGKDAQRPTLWQVIFLQSKVNGAYYRGEKLPQYRWDWPHDTYLQKRVGYLRGAHRYNQS